MAKEKIDTIRPCVTAKLTVLEVLAFGPWFLSKEFCNALTARNMSMKPWMKRTNREVQLLSTSSCLFVRPGAHRRTRFTAMAAEPRTPPTFPTFEVCTFAAILFLFVSLFIQLFLFFLYFFICLLVFFGIIFLNQFMNYFVH